MAHRTIFTDVGQEVQTGQEVALDNRVSKTDLQGGPLFGESPKYVRIVQSLTQRLSAKEWNAGEQLPGEEALALEYGVSHGTARKAIDQLVKQNILVRRQGAGTFVAMHDWRRALFHFFRLVGDDGRRVLPASRILTLEMAIATEVEARQLQLRRRAKVLRIVRVRSIDTVPIIVERLTLPASRFRKLSAQPGAEFPSLTYEHYSREHGIDVVEADERLRVVVADARECGILGLPIGHSLLEIDRIALDISKVPVEWRVSHCDTRRHFYSNHLN